ncbi:hypothetical protein KKE34_04075 [Patescibacteria group bacterium]|nr:hypothetical protein [Patescibacteria group bacterium]MBU1885757.1 hypothetical protein [Patescibacteria group bacterium]
MRKIILSLFLVLASVFAVGHGYALFQDLVVAKDNKFYSGQFDLQISITDADGDNIAETSISNWSGNVTNVWSTQLEWTPGDTISSKVFIRNTGDVDAESVYLTLTGRTYYGLKHLDEVVNLISAWYDRNGDGIQDANEDILPELISQYDTNGDDFTLLDFYSGTDLVHAGIAFDLEAGAEILPGSESYPINSLGGHAGHGKGLFLTWEYDQDASVNYQDAWVEVDLEFTGEQGTD